MYLRAYEAAFEYAEEKERRARAKRVRAAAEEITKAQGNPVAVAAPATIFMPLSSPPELPNKA